MESEKKSAAEAIEGRLNSLSVEDGEERKAIKETTTRGKSKYRRFEGNISRFNSQGKKKRTERGFKIIQEGLQNITEILEAKLKELGNANSDDEGGYVNVSKGFKVPEKLYHKLYPYQKDAIIWFWRLYQERKGGILGDDTGLGKTIQVIAFLAGMLKSEHIKNALIIMPVSNLPNWHEAFGKWAPEIRVGNFYGKYLKKRNENLADIQERNGVCLTTFALSNTCQEKLSRGKFGETFTWDYIILDEGHKIKNTTTKSALAIRAIQAKYHFILTDTPIQNNLKEMWALFDFVCQGQLLGTSRSFKQEYENPIVRARERDATACEKRIGQEKSAQLRELIAPYFLRRTKDILEQNTKTATSDDAAHNNIDEGSDKENEENNGISDQDLATAREEELSARSENESLAVQKKFQAEIARVEDALMQVRRDYEYYLKTNEQTGPMIKEMDHIIKNLQNSNRQLKAEVIRFKTKLSKEEEETKRLHTELENIISGKKPVAAAPATEEAPAEGTTTTSTGEETTTTDQKESQEDGELPTGSEELKALKSELKQSQESQKEMKIMLDVYKGASKDSREKLEILANEKRLKVEIEELHGKITEGKQELEKCKAAMADELALKRLKAANKTIEMLQRKIAATKQEEDALLSEMEFTGQAFEEMQEQNIRVLQELREKEEANLKLMSERIKGDQIQKQLKEEKDVMANQITALNSHIDAQEQVIKKLEERERSLQSTLSPPPSFIIDETDLDVEATVDGDLKQQFSAITLNHCLNQPSAVSREEPSNVVIERKRNQGLSNVKKQQAEDPFSPILFSSPEIISGDENKMGENMTDVIEDSRFQF